MQGRTRESVQRCRAVLASQPGNVGAARLLGELLRKLGQHEESVRTLVALHRSRPHDARVASELGASLVAAQQATQAIPLLKRAVDVFPDDPAHRVWLGRAMMQMFRPSGAIAAFEEARRLDPEDTEISLLLASAHLSAGQALLARPILEQLARDEPEDPSVQTALAQALEQLSCLTEARAAYRRAGRADHDGLAAAGLVRCLLAEGHIDEAADAARDAFDTGPTPHTTLALARVLLARRAPDEACAILEPALAESARARTARDRAVVCPRRGARTTRRLPRRLRGVQQGQRPLPGRIQPGPRGDPPRGLDRRGLPGAPGTPRARRAPTRPASCSSSACPGPEPH
ncbi:MAG: tetratricopeptide repeat protein [Planctomycetota bacterium]|nr:MAG: tetratricopeptide repeat protein [Planctomycetota bacterium]